MEEELVEKNCGKNLTGMEEAAENGEELSDCACGSGMDGLSHCACGSGMDGLSHCACGSGMDGLTK
jgi:hypothetical protein